MLFAGGILLTTCEHYGETFYLILAFEEIAQSNMRNQTKLLLASSTLATLGLTSLIYFTCGFTYANERYDMFPRFFAIEIPTTIEPKRWRIFVTHRPTTIRPKSKRKADAVILLTQCRSGSSFVGEMFNRQRNVSYFYEPLFPFREASCHPNPAYLANVTVRALEGLVNCRFDDFPNLYRIAYATTKQRDQARCREFNLCFVECGKCHAFLKRDSRVCNGIGKRCPRPLNLTLLGDHCRRSTFRAAKINYLSDLRLIAPMLDHDRYNVTVKVVHLVRDPRATALSKYRTGIVKGKITKEYVRRVLPKVCARLRRNALYANYHLKGGDAYLRMRHEDVSLRPVQHARAIYDFAGREPSDELMRWLRKSTTAKSKKRFDPFGTTRNSAAVISAWRTDDELSFDVVDAIQRVCADAMRLLGYRPFRSAREMANLTVPSFV